MVSKYLDICVTCTGSKAPKVWETVLSASCLDNIPKSLLDITVDGYSSGGKVPHLSAISLAVYVLLLLAQRGCDHHSSISLISLCNLARLVSNSSCADILLMNVHSE